MRNELAGATSPYLLQHADNPVHWREWGPQALEEAKREGKPLLVSIGYAACHWCHVMAHESFEDEATADYLNAHFVPIKVDREERPDLDAFYMASLQAMGEQGGWPLTVFAEPDGAPFYAGTYFPPEPRYGRPSFRQVCEAILAARQRGEGVAENRAALLDHLRSRAAPVSGPLDPPLLDQAARRVLSLWDEEVGGFRGAPKFPQAPVQMLLWAAFARTGDASLRDAVVRALASINDRGTFDHLAGGWHRYAVDGGWRVPHFEKMLYDNAQLIELNARAALVAPDGGYLERIEMTVEWLKAEMTTDEGLLASSLDADTEGEEGRFYVWSDAELSEALGEEAEAARDALTHPDALLDGRYVLQRPATTLHDERLDPLVERLAEAREGRERPGRDDKVLTDWNGLAIEGLARAGMLLDRADWVAFASDLFARLREHCEVADDGKAQLVHSRRQGRVGAAGLASDHASACAAAVALFEATGDDAYLDTALRWAEALETRFAHPSGGYHDNAEAENDLPVRPYGAGDDATPSANGQMALVHARLFHLTGDVRQRRAAERVMEAFGGLVARDVIGSSTLQRAYDVMLRGSLIVIVGGSEVERSALARQAREGNDPARMVISVADTTALREGHPAHGKPALEGQATVYVCEEGVCGVPAVGHQASDLLSPSVDLAS